MIVHGSDVYCTIDSGGGIQKSVCCARNATISTNADIGETSTLGTGKWKTYKGLKMSFTISLGGLVSFDMNYSIALLRQRQINFEQINFVFFGSDQNNNQETYSGSFIVTSISTPTTYSGNFEYTVEGQGTGTLNVTRTAGSPQTQAAISWGWQATPFTTATLPGFAYQQTANLFVGSSLSIDFTGSSGYLAVQYPSTLQTFTAWKNTAFNYGVIPDQVFNSIYTSGGFRYIYSRIIPALDQNNKKIVFS